MDYKKDNIPDFKVGDTLRVHVKIIEVREKESRFSRVMYLRDSTAALTRLSQ